MGASKEGMMRVRDKINLVLHNFFSEEEDDPPDTTRSSTTSASGGVSLHSNKRSDSAVPTTTAVAVTPVINCNNEESLTSSSSNCNSEESICIDERKGLSSQASTMSPKVRTSGVGDAKSGDSVIVEHHGSIVISNENHHHHQFDSLVGEDTDNKHIILQDLLARQLRLINSLQARLSNAEGKVEKVEKERDLLQENLKSERQKNAEAQLESDDLIRTKEEKIQELEKQLEIVTTKKPTEDKETCVTPPPAPPTPPPPSPVTSPTPPPPPSQTQHIVQVVKQEGMLQDREEEDEEEYLQPPQRKRPKLDLLGRRETPFSSFLPPPSSRKAFFSSKSSLSLYQSSRTHPSYYHNQKRRSDSPPQLSPAVTPKSSLLKTAGRPNEFRSFLGQELHEDNFVSSDSIDELQDELDRLDRMLLQSTSASRDKVIKFRPADHNRVNSKQQFMSYSSSSCAQQSSSSAAHGSASGFGRSHGQFTKPRHTRFMFPEGKRRFMNTTSSFLPVSNNKSRHPHQYPSPSSASTGISSSLPKSTNSFVLPSSNSNSRHSLGGHSQQQHAGIRNRSNNFLNLSRPLAKKAPVVIVPPPQSSSTSHRTPSSSSHFRSLDGAAAIAAAAASSSQFYRHQQRKNDQASTLVPLITPPAAKKRKVGRPPGSGLKSKPVSGRMSSLFSSSSGQSPGLPNGSIAPSQEPPCPPPPQRFSQRGRLLKPNRARYSPDPDVSVSTTPREKFFTTKRGYFVGEPFIQPRYDGEEEDSQGLEESESSLGGTILPPREVGIENIDDEEATVALATSSLKSSLLYQHADHMEDGSEKGIFVEVPKWRVNILEGYNEYEEKHEAEDDMSDEAFYKRHQKLEAKEKQRKRWDSQRMREESYLERLKRKQEERELQKELRRQQRKRNKGRNGANEEESITPSVEEVKAIHIGAELPVGAFGHPLPLVEKVIFKLDWEITPPEAATTAKKSTCPSPSLQQKNVENIASNLREGKSDNISSEDTDKSSSIPSSSTPSSSTPSSSPSLEPPAASSPSSSSLSLPSIPSPSASPPPPIIFPVYDDQFVVACDNDNSSSGHSKGDDEPTPETESGDCEITMETSRTTAIAAADGEEHTESSSAPAPCSPVFSVDLVDYVNNSDEPFMPNDSDDINEENDSGSRGGDNDTNCDITCSANPNSSPSSSTVSEPSLPSPANNNNNTTIAVSSEGSISGNNCNNKQDLKRKNNSTVVRLPQMKIFPTPSSSSSSSSSSASSFSSSSVSKTSITFFIPNNPLAPRHQHPHRSSSISASSQGACSSSSTTNKSSSSSEYCKDNNS